MAYINIADKKHDIKVISIDKKCLTDDTVRLLEGNETYRDTEERIGEHLYSAHDILENIGGIMLDTEQLELIKETCLEHGAQFFRIIDIKLF